MMAPWPSANGAAMDSRLHQYLTNREQVGHDLHLGQVNAEGFRSARDFIRACEKVGVWRLKQGELPADAGFYIGEPAEELAQTTRTLIERGDVMLARQLPPIAEILHRALRV